MYYNKPKPEALTAEEVAILELVGSEGWSEVLKPVFIAAADAQSKLLNDDSLTLEQIRYEQGRLAGCSIISNHINAIIEKQEALEKEKEDALE